jgi:hypothetical protein
MNYAIILPDIRQNLWINVFIEMEKLNLLGREAGVYLIFFEGLDKQLKI